VTLDDATTAPSRDPAPVFPLAVGPTGRYLVDHHGAPFLIHGDTAWSLLVGATWEDAQRYLDDRRDKGVNAIIVNLIEHLFAPSPPRTVYGDEPFLVPGDFSTPNEAYFAHADRVVRRAGELGILVALAPCYLGYRKPDFPGFGRRAHGWYDEVIANGVDKCREYGRYLGRRYRDVDNVLWVMSGDRCPGSALDHVRAMVDGIRAEDAPHRLFTAHVHPECRPLESYPDDPWLAVNQTYTYAIVHRKLLEEYNEIPPRPNVLFESTYEGEHRASEVQIRRQAYWALLSGACGQFLGTYPTWLFGQGWQAALESPGSLAMIHLRALFQARRWWDLVPDQGHTIVVDGIGEETGLDYCATAATPDGRLAIAYLPTPRAITLDLSALHQGDLTVRWFDPRRGDFLEADGRPEPGDGHLVLYTPPWNHDAVLLIEADSPVGTTVDGDA
jgi:hypothetical protein